MTAPVRTVQPNDSIRSIVGLFEQEHFHHTFVVERDRLTGVVSDRDVLRALLTAWHPPNEGRPDEGGVMDSPVHQIMSRALVTIGPDDEVSAAGEKMLSERVSCLPVVDKHVRALGIVTVRDIAAWRIQIKVNILAAIFALQVEQFHHQFVGVSRMDFALKKHNAVLQEKISQRQLSLPLVLLVRI
ncbi:MAG: CBS domain-containing protein [Planctomycetes bacterium]|nr:CBS domain-containing protein [Planctomycetota bacterium]